MEQLNSQIHYEHIFLFSTNYLFSRCQKMTYKNQNLAQNKL